jgi:hypothetical protein
MHGLHGLGLDHLLLAAAGLQQSRHLHDVTPLRCVHTYDVEPGSR